MVPSLPWLPAELQAMIIPHLTYPDLLALRLSHPHYYYNISTTVHQRVVWLIRRHHDGRTTAQASQCILKTDQEFLSNPEVRRILKEEWQSSSRARKAQSWWGWKWSKTGSRYESCTCSCITAIGSSLVAFAGVLLAAISFSREQ
jgi:hypothetical protein